MSTWLCPACMTLTGPTNAPCPKCGSSVERAIIATGPPRREDAGDEKPMDYRHPLEMHHARREDAAGAAARIARIREQAAGSDYYVSWVRDDVNVLLAALSTAEREPGNITLSADDVEALRFCVTRAEHCCRSHEPRAYVSAMGKLAQAYDILARVPSGGEEGR